MSQNREWFKNVQQSVDKTINLDSTLVIEKVAKDSPAESIELQAGDSLVSLNGENASSVSVPDVLINATAIDYVVYRRASESRVSFTTDALPLGLRLTPTTNNIVKSFQTTSLDTGDGLRLLWERGDYEQIRNVCEHASSSKKKQHKDAKAIGNLMLAICDIEAGANKSKAYAKLEKFPVNTRGYTTSYTSLVDYYLALKARDEGIDHTFKDRMWRAMHTNHDCARIKADADAGGVQYVAANPRLGKKYDFPAAMPYLEGGKGTTSLARIVKPMSEDQVLPICFMMTYRGNGPYNDCLKAYHSMYPHCADKMLPMVVITNEAHKEPAYPQWFEAEEALASAGIPITILLDESAMFADGYLQSAPEFIGIKKDLTIVWDDSLHDDYAYWQMLAADVST